ncbi:MAG TPA: beta-L-arabinofuranosidase domain-containing protein, partial [Chloroflexia bacterium]|nr:beta-L-arabinofuranosidase domain-containing protein [Chloroflexia bacterium]
MDDPFWASRIETNQSITIPLAFEKCEETGRVDNFRRAAEVLRGTPGADRTPPRLVWDDSDVYKVIEGDAYALSTRPDPALEEYVDGLVALIAAAQEPDGYLYTARTIDPETPPTYAGSRRWELERKASHELYNLGHLYEAAVAHYQATGKRGLLEVALKSADLLDNTFGPGKESIWPGHQVAEIALVKLYRLTSDPRYLALAKFLLEARGPDGR